MMGTKRHCETPSIAACSNTPAGFTSIATIPSITAQYVEWQVVTTNGANPGASNFSFYVTPEPASLVVWGLVIAGCFVMARRRKA